MFLRPTHHSRWRRTWNLGHHWIGRTAIGLGIANVYIGLIDEAQEETKYVIAYSVVRPPSWLLEFLPAYALPLFTLLNIGWVVTSRVGVVKMQGTLCTPVQFFFDQLSRHTWAERTSEAPFQSVTVFVL